MLRMTRGDIGGMYFLLDSKNLSEFPRFFFFWFKIWITMNLSGIHLEKCILWLLSEWSHKMLASMCANLALTRLKLEMVEKLIFFVTKTVLKIGFGGLVLRNTHNTGYTGLNSIWKCQSLVMNTYEKFFGPHYGSEFLLRFTYMQPDVQKKVFFSQSLKRKRKFQRLLVFPQMGEYFHNSSTPLS